MGLKRSLHGISKVGVMEQSFIFKPKFGVGPGAIAVASAACLPGPQPDWSLLAPQNTFL